MKDAGLVPGDEALDRLYRRKLLEPGWAGDLSDGEAEYLAGMLSADARLRSRWYKGTLFKRMRRVTPYMAHQLVAHWLNRSPDPDAAA